MFDNIPMEEVDNMNYLDYKAKILYQIGLTDIDGVKDYLEDKSMDAKTELNRRVKIDNAARQIMMDYYDGDRTFIARRRVNQRDLYAV